MAPKKKKGAKKTGGLSPEDVERFKTVYEELCKRTNQEPCNMVIHQLSDEEAKQEFCDNNQIIIVDDSLRSSGARALATAMLTGGTTGNPGDEVASVTSGHPKPFNGILALRIKSSRIGDDGLIALAEVARLGGAECPVELLELPDNQIGPRGCRSLGSALMIGANRSILHLNLNFNPSIGSEGAAFLSRGLRSNSTLVQLHLCYCGLDEDAAAPLADALAYQKSGIILCNLTGNRLSDEGLRKLSPGLGLNKSLKHLNLNDNRIGSTASPRAIVCMDAFCNALRNHPVLDTLCLKGNILCPEVCDALLPALQNPGDPTKPNPRFKLVCVDAGLKISQGVYEQLNISGGGAGGKKKKGKKKK